MKKIVSLVLSLSMVGTLCANTACAAGVNKIESKSNDSKVIYVSSENIENYKDKLLKDIEKYSNIENQFSSDGSIRKILNNSYPYVVAATLYSSIACLIFDYFFEKNDTNTDVQSRNNGITESTEISKDASTEKKIGILKSLAQSFKRKYRYTGGAISSKKEKRIIVRTFLLNLSASVLSFFFGIIFPDLVSDHYSDKVRILKGIKHDLTWCENHQEDCGDIKSCGMKIILDEKSEFCPAQVYPQENFNK